MALCAEAETAGPIYRVRILRGPPRARHRGGDPRGGRRETRGGAGRDYLLRGPSWARPLRTHAGRGGHACAERDSRRRFLRPGPDRRDERDHPRRSGPVLLETLRAVREPFYGNPTLARGRFF